MLALSALALQDLEEDETGEDDEEDDDDLDDIIEEEEDGEGHVDVGSGPIVEVLAPKAQDGTRCRPGSLDMCINGKCQVS